MKIRNRRLTEEEMFQRGGEGFKVWPTGEEIDFKEGIAYQKALPRERVAVYKHRRAKEEGVTLIQPRAGTVPIEHQIDHLQYLQEAGADFGCIINDNYSRTRKLEEAKRGLEETIRLGRPMLNGFPIILYGVKGVRRVLESVSIPVRSALCYEGDWRIDMGIYLTAGANYMVAGPIGHTIPYEKNVPLEPAITNMQVVDRMVGYFEEHGVPIVREYHMTLTGTFVPFSIAISILVIEALLAAEQGVRNILQQFGLCGCLVQDVAALRVLDRMTQEYLHRFGYTGVDNFVGCSQWMGNFPKDETRSLGVISWGAATAALGGAVMVITKSTHEAYGIPTKEANAAGVKASRQVVEMLRNQRLEVTGGVKEEMEVIEREAKAILERTLELGDGDIALGVLKAFSSGIIDVPFSPSIHNAGKVLPVRDATGAVRFLEYGNIPLPRDIVDFHKRKIAERAKRENREIDWEAVRDDIFFVSRDQW